MHMADASEPLSGTFSPLCTQGAMTTANPCSRVNQSVSRAIPVLRSEASLCSLYEYCIMNYTLKF